MLEELRDFISKTNNSWFPDLKDHEYHQLKDFVSASKLKTLYNKSPAHLKAEMDGQVEPTKAMLLGSLIHEIVFFPWKRNLIRVMPDIDKRTREGKAELERWKSDLPDGAIVITNEESNVVLGILNSIQNHPKASKLLSGGIAERAGFFDYEDLKFKFKPDFVRDDGIILDLKTTISTNQYKFGYQAMDNGLLIQAAVYCLGYEIIEKKKPRAFIFVATEKEPPYDVVCYYVPTQALELGNIYMHKAIEIYKQCIQTGVWPGRSNEIVELFVDSKYYERKDIEVLE